jgi:hypothetical protein
MSLQNVSSTDCRILKKKVSILAVILLFDEFVTEFVRMQLEKLITGTYLSF